MLRREEVKLELSKDAQREKELTDKISAIRERTMGSLIEKGEALQNRFTRLLNAKRSLFEAPCSKQELLTEAKIALKKYQEQIGLPRLLAENLSKSMANGGAFPLRPDHMKTTVFADGDFSKIIYWVVTEALLEKVVAGLPDLEGALSAAERARELKKLDDQILQLEKEIGEED